MSGDSIGKLGFTTKAYKTLVTIFSNLLKMTTVHRPLFCDFKIPKMAQNKGRSQNKGRLAQNKGNLTDFRYNCRSIYSDYL